MVKVCTCNLIGGALVYRVCLVLLNNCGGLFNKMAVILIHSLTFKRIGCSILYFMFFNSFGIYFSLVKRRLQLHHMIHICRCVNNQLKVQDYPMDDFTFYFIRGTSIEWKLDSIFIHRLLPF